MVNSRHLNVQSLFYKSSFILVSAFPFTFGSSYPPPLPIVLLCFTWHIRDKRKIEVAII